MNKVTIHKSIQSIQTVSRRIKKSSYGLCMHSQLPNSFLLDLSLFFLFLLRQQWHFPGLLSMEKLCLGGVKHGQSRMPQQPIRHCSLTSFSGFRLVKFSTVLLYVLQSVFLHLLQVYLQLFRQSLFFLVSSFRFELVLSTLFLLPCYPFLCMTSRKTSTALVATDAKDKYST